MLKNAHKLFFVLVLGLCLAETVGAVTHEIKNDSDHNITATIYYRGHIEKLGTCRPDEQEIEPGKSLISKAGICLLSYVQVKDGDKTFKLNVSFLTRKDTILAGAAAGAASSLLRIATIIAGLESSSPRFMQYIHNLDTPELARSLATLGTGGAAMGAISGSFAGTLISALLQQYDFIVYPTKSTKWIYTGQNLLPVEGVKIIEKPETKTPPEKK